ncbi:hypothetical protein L6R53_29370 [Myxococcota bacterium]|nr:hypothetical protein [Myxococcota bacterium]
MSHLLVPDWIRATCPDLRAALPLKGSLPGGAGEPWLVHRPSGPHLVGRREGQVEQVDLAQVSARHQARLLGDQLLVDGQALSVPVGQGDQARALLAAARLEAWAGHPPPPAPPPPGPADLVDPWIQDPLPQDALWTALRLAPGEELIAWLPTTTEAPLRDPLDPAARVAWRWCLTDRRNLLVALSPLGVALEVELPAGTVLVDGGGGCHAADRRWQVDKRRLAVARELAPLCGLPPEDRAREAARALAHRDDAAARAHAARLLASLSPLGRPLGFLRRAAVARLAPPLPPEVREELARLPSRPDLEPEDLVTWVETWPASDALAQAVMEALRAVDPAFALPLHEVLHERAALSLRAGHLDRGADLGLARHHIEAGRPDGVERLLAPHLAGLAPGGPDRVLPGEGADADGTSSEEVALLEALAAARRARGAEDAGLLAELARREPLSAARLQALADARQAPAPLRERARRALALWDPAPEPLPPPTRALPRTLSPSDLDRLVHPGIGGGGPVSALATALARVEPPDTGALADYCERLDPAQHPAAAAALAEAAQLLGLPAVPAFVSRGQRNVGLRAHERPEPFLLVGGAHLDPASGLCMRPAELAFAVGAELAHLRWHHTRVRTDEVWAGLWDKGSMALSTTAAMLPVLDLFRVPGRLVRLGAAGVSAAGPLRAVGERLAGERAPGAPAPDVGVDPARLLAAHRAMQLSADRAGLVLCGDPVAAARAIFLQHSRLQPELTLAARQGLLPTIQRRDEQGRPLLPHIQERLASLIAFWLSDDYADLVGQAWPADPG